MTGASNYLLKVEKLSKRFTLRPGLFSRRGLSLTAIDQVDLSMEPGQIYGLVGESGSGKSTLGRAILQLTRADSGKVYFKGIDLCTSSPRALNAAREKLQVVFQDSSSSLSPRRTILQSLLEPLEQFRIGDRVEHPLYCEQVLETVGLGKEVLARLPHQLSSGQRQRIGIARAILTRPDLIIADEPVSSLDVSVQAQILNLIRELRTRNGIAFLFISHDLAVISQVADVVGVMFQGQIVETAPVKSLFENASHPYTRQLLAAIPNPDPSVQMSAVHGNAGLTRSVKTQGCVFASRCPSVMPMCLEHSPVYSSVGTVDQHHVRCHLREQETEKHDQG